MHMKTEPPVKEVELEKLNTATDNINKFEVELDNIYEKLARNYFNLCKKFNIKLSKDAKSEFKRLLAESVVRIKQAAHKLGNSIEAAKPYYESRIYAAQLSKETQQAAADHEKAKSMHSAAKEMVYLAEQGLGEKSTLDTACQEMLSHAASKVNQSQLEVTETRNSLKMCQLKLDVANNRVGKLQGQLKQAIKASRSNIRRNYLYLSLLAHRNSLGKTNLPYYETRANFNGLLKTQKGKINELETKVSEAKMSYNEALKNLEQISEDIHRQRQEQRDLLRFETMSRSTTNKHMNVVDCDVQSYQRFPCKIDSTDEYLDLPDKLSTNSSPVRQKRPDIHECPHLLHDFEAVLTFPQKLANGMHKSASTSTADDNIFVQAQLHGPYDIKSSNSIGGSGSGGHSAHDASTSTGCGDTDDNDIEQWTEIRLSHSDSTSSSYSNQSLLHDQAALDGREDIHSQHSSSSSDEPKRKVTCTTIFHEDQVNKKQGLSQWLSRSNSFKSNGRRQSLDLLIDAGDKVKDVFTLSFQKVGKTLERRNSESEMNADEESVASGTTTSAGDFFLFSRSSEPKELLSDEQVENLLLNHRVDENGAIIVEELKSPLQ